MKGSERESRGADRPAPHADTFAPQPPTSPGGLGRQEVRGAKPRLLPVAALFFLPQIRAAVGANRPASGVLTLLFVFGSGSFESSGFEFKPMTKSENRLLEKKKTETPSKNA